MPSGPNICLEPQTLLIPPAGKSQFSDPPGRPLVHLGFRLPRLKLYLAELSSLRTEFNSPV